MWHTLIKLKTTFFLQTTQQALEPSDQVSTDRSRMCTSCPFWSWTVDPQLLAQLAHLPSMSVGVTHTESSSPAMPRPSAWAQPSAQELLLPCLSACSSSLVKNTFIFCISCKSKHLWANMDVVVRSSFLWPYSACDAILSTWARISMNCALILVKFMSQKIILFCGQSENQYPLLL